MRHLKIKVGAGGNGSIQLDGKEIGDRVVAVGFNSSVDERTEVTLVMSIDEVEIEAEIDDEEFHMPDYKNSEGI